MGPTIAQRVVTDPNWLAAWKGTWGGPHVSGGDSQAQVNENVLSRWLVGGLFSSAVDFGRVIRVEIKKLSCWVFSQLCRPSAYDRILAIPCPFPVKLLALASAIRGQMPPPGLRGNKWALKRGLLADEVSTPYMIELLLDQYYFTWWFGTNFNLCTFVGATWSS